MTNTQTIPQVTRESFFQDLLIPTGQMAELLVKVLQARPAKYKQSHPRSAQRLSHTLFDILGLAAAYAANPANQELEKVAERVDGLAKHIAGLLKSLGGYKEKVVDAVLRGRAVSLTKRASWVNFEAEFDTYMASTLETDLAQLHNAIGYLPLSRHLWLKQHASGSYLTLGGCTNKWRMFVRHTSWERALRALGLATKIAPELHRENRFSSRAGRMAAERTWPLAFGSEAVNVRPTAVMSSAPDSLLPPDVAVKSLGDGTLQVSAVYEPKKLIGINDRNLYRLNRKTVPKELAALIEERSMAMACDVLGLPAAVEHAKKWLAEQAGGDAAALAAFKEWKRQLKEKELVERLNKTFSPDEQRMLSEMFRRAGAEVPAAS